MTRNARKFRYCSISVSHMEHPGGGFFFNCIVIRNLLHIQNVDTVGVLPVGF
jgi:hypothetical protein